MDQSINEVTINDTVYIRKDSIIATKPAESLDGMEYVIVRTYSAGVFAGYLASQKGKQIIIKRARRLWYWAGAASLSQLAVDGSSKPSDCKFPCEVAEITVTEAIEILHVTQKAKDSLAEVAIWQL